MVQKQIAPAQEPAKKEEEKAAEWEKTHISLIFIETFPYLKITK